MGAPTLAQFTTSVPAINNQVFNRKQLRCLMVYGLASLASQGVGVAVTDYTQNLANSSTSLLKTASDLIGSIPQDRLLNASVMDLMARASFNSTYGPSTFSTFISKLQECSDKDVEMCETFILSLFIQSVGL